MDSRKDGWNDNGTNGPEICDWYSISIIMSHSFLVDHQLEMNGSFALGAIMFDIVGPCFALDIDDDSTWNWM